MSYVAAVMSQKAHFSTTNEAILCFIYRSLDLASILSSAYEWIKWIDRMTSQWSININSN